MNLMTYNHSTWKLWKHLFMSDLFAVFVVVHAGQRAVGIPVNVRVHTARVPVTGPAHITLETHTSHTVNVGSL